MIKPNLAISWWWRTIHEKQLLGKHAEVGAKNRGNFHYLLGVNVV
jgi:hypothetical protein